MEAPILIAVTVAILLLLDVSAVLKGADSRDNVGDDWARPTTR